MVKLQKRPKIIDIQLGFSRDGVTYPRPSREAFIAAARKPGTWNRGYLHAANGVCLIVGDELWFYFGTWSGQSKRKNPEWVMAGKGHFDIIRKRQFVDDSLDVLTTSFV